MMTEMKKSRSLSQFVMAVGAVAFGLMVTGCSQQECVDRFDCQNSKEPRPRASSTRARPMSVW
ncbi:hypothetical protein ACN28S_51275 [Cystobacter fuscus]